MESKQKGKLRIEHSTLTIVFTFIFAVALYFVGKYVDGWHEILISWGYLGVFIVGFLYTYSLTAAPATALLLIIGNNGHLGMTLFAVSLGALFGDILMHVLFRSTLPEHEAVNDRYHRFFNRLYRRFPWLNTNFFHVLIVILVYVSPLPNELGNFMLARTRSINFRSFLAISFILNSVGLALLLLLSRA